jgi:hypothetical protein
MDMPQKKSLALMASLDVIQELIPWHLLSPDYPDIRSSSLIANGISVASLR